MRSLMQRDAVTVQQWLYVQAAHGGVVLSHSLQSLNRSAGKSGMQDIYAVVILRRSVVQDRCNGHTRVGGVVIICGKNHRNLSGSQNRCAHIDFYEGNLTIFAESKIKIFDSAFCGNGNTCLIDNAVVVSIFCDTADAVSAHGALRTVEAACDR